MGAGPCTPYCCYTRSVRQISVTRKKPAATQATHTHNCVPLTANKEGGPTLGSQIQGFLIMACDQRHKNHLGITEEMHSPGSPVNH